MILKEKWKWPKNQDDLQNLDHLENKDEAKNENDAKEEDNPKKEDNPKTEDDPKIKPELKGWKKNWWNFPLKGLWDCFHFVDFLTFWLSCSFFYDLFTTVGS